jgi:hypothetical protein
MGGRFVDRALHLRKDGTAARRVETLNSVRAGVRRKTIDIAEPYLDRPERELMLCVDEQSQIQVGLRASTSYCAPSGNRESAGSSARSQLSGRGKMKRKSVRRSSNPQD